jgi:hypothetical protein
MSQHAIETCQHIGVPESEYCVALRSEPSVSDNVAGTLVVLATIDLDDQAFLATEKVDDISTHGRLTAKFPFTEAPVTECIPEFFLSVGGFVAHCTSSTPA